MRFGQNNTDGMIGLGNFKSQSNWVDLAFAANQLPDHLFGFDVRNQNTATYFYAGKSSFPSGVSLLWFPSSLSNYWVLSIKASTINGVTNPTDWND